MHKEKLSYCETARRFEVNSDTWNNYLAAAERYGSFVDAMLGGIEAEIASINAQIESLRGICS